jgi:uncharacterized peroxidase-related enzyme
MDVDERASLVAQLERDLTAPSLDPADRAMLDYAVKLTRTPGAMARDDVETLRRHGFDDRAIHDVCAITGYFAFVNRIADGLGVDLEEE